MQPSRSMVSRMVPLPEASRGGHNPWWTRISRLASVLVSSICSMYVLCPAICVCHLLGDRGGRELLEVMVDSGQLSVISLEWSGSVPDERLFAAGQ